MKNRKNTNVRINEKVEWKDTRQRWDDFDGYIEECLKDLRGGLIYVTDPERKSKNIIQRSMFYLKTIKLIEISNIVSLKS